MFNAIVKKFLLGAALTLAFWPSTARAADPLNCTGYPQPRVFLESGAWYQPPEGQPGHKYGHIYSGTCFPWKQKVSGIVHFDVRYTMYETQGTMTSADIQVQDTAGVHLLAKVSTSNRCFSSTPCAFWLGLNADTTKTAHDGRQEFRIRASITEPDGKVSIVTNGWQAYLANGKSYANYRSTDNFTEGRGWYTSDGYSQGRLDSPIPGAVGAAPVSGTWTFKVDIKPGAGGIPVTHTFVAIDPDYEIEPDVDGLVLLSVYGQYIGNLSINTTHLTPGKHILWLQADAEDSTGNVNTGVLKIPFVVSN